MDTTKVDAPRPPPVSADDATMWAVVQDRYGSAPEDVLRLARIDKPTLADDEVLLRVHAAGLDDAMSSERDQRRMDVSTRRYLSPYRLSGTT